MAKELEADSLSQVPMFDPENTPAQHTFSPKNLVICREVESLLFHAGVLEGFSHQATAHPQLLGIHIKLRGLMESSLTWLEVNQIALFHCSPTPPFTPSHSLWFTP